jgi:hypothetical protein
MEDTFIFAWSSIPSVEHYRWLHSPICQLPPNNSSHHSTHLGFLAIMNYCCGITQDSTCNCNSLLNFSIIRINVSFIMKPMLPFSPYHTIYLILFNYRPVSIPVVLFKCDWVKNEVDR